MILVIPALLGPDGVRRCRELLEAAPWVDGRATAGAQSALAKRNRQVPESAREAEAAGRIVLEALGAHPLFVSAALPARIYPPLFSRYGPGMGFGDHVDNAVRVSPVSGAAYRTDVSCTLFLSDPDDYEGGELVIGEAGAAREVKGAAGDLVLYPATTVHRVEPVTAGERRACVFWVQSMVADAGTRALLFELDRAIASARADLGDAHPAAVSLTGIYHNLIRRWARL